METRILMAKFLLILLTFILRIPLFAAQPQPCVTLQAYVKLMYNQRFNSGFGHFLVKNGDEALGPDRGVSCLTVCAVNIANAASVAFFNKSLGKLSDIVKTERQILIQEGLVTPGSGNVAGKQNEAFLATLRRQLKNPNIEIENKNFEEVDFSEADVTQPRSTGSVDRLNIIQYAVIDMVSSRVVLSHLQVVLEVKNESGTILITSDPNYPEYKLAFRLKSFVLSSGDEQNVRHHITFELVPDQRYGDAVAKFPNTFANVVTNIVTVNVPKSL